MTDECRPDPDALLARVEEEERRKKRGRLNIFLGYAAGVGKTYAMLEAAQRLRAEGVDVVVGYVDTHDRVETEALLEGLEMIPRQELGYHGIRVPEMDLDAVLARKPQLALVDELAHTNAPNSRHLKRWQDVEELLAKGIDVYTTLNVQHLESLNDIVAQITGIKVRETLPDCVLDGAEEIKLVDIPPEELLQRLQEGKVYIPEQAAEAMRKFFQEGNLIALREVSLRRAANRVDEQMRAYMQTYAIPGPWPAAERLLVCVSGSPFSERLIRTTRRLAEEMKAEWFALYVEAPSQDKLTRENRERVWRDLRLAESLGAKVGTVTADSIAEAVVQFARKNNITKVIVGRPIRPWWRELLRGPVVDQIIRQGTTIDVYVVGAAPQDKKTEALRTAKPAQPWRAYAVSLALVLATTLVNEIVQLFLSPTNLVMLYLLAVVLAAVRLGYRPAIATAFMSVLAFDFFFVPPRFTMRVSDTEYLITFLGLFTVGALISTLVSRTREQAAAVRTREVQTATLYSLSRDLAAAADLKTILNTVINHISRTLEARIAIFLPEEDALHIRAASPDLFIDENEKAVADWAFRNRQVAGRGTETLRSAQMLFVPLQTADTVVGVLAVSLAGEAAYRTLETRRLLEAFASQAAIAIERANLAEKAEESQVLQATEKLERALLNSISHDLRTPLVSITGALSSLREEGHHLNEEARRELMDTAFGEAGRLNRFVGNLLDMTRLEGGALRVKEEPCDVQDLIGSALAVIERRISGMNIQVNVPPTLPLVPMDFALMTQVLVNLLDNAVKYSPTEGSVEISTRLREAWLEIEVADRGPGIPHEDLQRVFDKFYRVSHSDGTGGTGLGLAISKGIVETHGGRIWAENRSEGGVRIMVELPLPQRATDRRT